MNYNHNTMGRVVTIGEVYLIATTMDKLKFEQSATLGVTFRGSEINVAASLSKFGVDVSHITAVSDNILGEAAVAWIRHHGIDTSFVRKNEMSIPMRFVEEGVGIRSSREAVVNFETAFESLDPKILDWNKIFKGCSWIFWSSASITPKLFNTIKAGLEVTQSRSINILADLSLINSANVKKSDENHHWKNLLSFPSTIICGVKDMNVLLESNFTTEKEGFINSCIALTKIYPAVMSIFDKVCVGSKCFGRAWVGGQYIETREFEIGTILEKSGTSEAFSSALLYAIRYYDEQQALNFATASYAIKHTIHGDYNNASINEVLDVLKISNKVIH